MSKSPRTVKPTKVPSIPSPPADVSPQMRTYLASISEALDIRLGRRGDKRDRAVTLRELIKSGLAQDLGDRAFNPSDPGDDIGNPSQPQPVEYPVAPTGFTVAAGYAQIQLQWDTPQTLYFGHSVTEIWRHDADVIGDAQLVGISGGSFFIDPVGEDTTRYYWIRFVNINGEIGPYNSADGTAGTTSPNVDLILDELANAISASELNATLTSRINLIDGGPDLTGSVNNRLSCVNASIAAAVNDISCNAAAVAAAALDVRCNAAAIAATAQDLSDEITNRTTAINCATAAINATIAELSDIAGYNNSTTYEIGDLVVHNSVIYRAIAQTTGNTPPNTTYWVVRGNYTNLADFVAALATENTNTLASLRSDYFTEVCARSAIAASVLGLASQTYVNDALTHYTNTATLQQTYFTETCARSAIAAAVLNLASQTYVTDQLSHYTNTATLQNTYFTETCARSAIAAAVLGLASQTYVTNQLSHYTNTATLQNAYITETCARSAIAAAVLNLATQTYVTNQLSHYTNTATLQNAYFTETCARSAIAAAVLGLASQTYVTDQLSHYTNTATLQNTYFTETCARSAIAAAVLGLASTTYVQGQLSHYTNTATLQHAYFTETCARSAIAAAVLGLASTTYVQGQLSHYTNTATLQNAYFTETCARSAIAAAVLGLASETFVTGKLSHYTNTATLQNTYFTETCARAAIAAAVLNLASTTDVNNALSHYTTTASLQNAYFTETCARAAISAAVLNLASETFVSGELSNYTTTADLQTNYYTKTDADTAIAGYTNTLIAQYSNFDVGQVWNFEDGVESWTGVYSTLAASGGVLTTITTNNDPLIRVSNLSIDGGAFPIIRARIKRVAGSGPATWDGKAFYTTSGHGESASYKKVVRPFSPHYVYNFDNGSLDGWEAVNGTVTSSGGLLIHETTASNPRIRLTGLTINGGDNPRVKMVVKRVAGSGAATWDGKLFYTTSGHGETTDYIKTVATDPTNTSDFVTVDWDMSALTNGGNDWLNNTITGLRFDLATTSGNKFEIDSISVGTDDPTNTTDFVLIDWDMSDLTTGGNDWINSTITGLRLDLADTTGNQFEIDWIAVGNKGPSDYRSALEVEATARANADGSLQAQYTVKIDNAGHVSGYGLASTAVDGTPTSEFGVRADQFWIAPPAIVSNSAPSTNLYQGKVWVDTSGSEDVTKYYDVDTSSWGTTPSALPFVVQASPVLDGDGNVDIPAGVYMDSAFIKNGSITTAQIKEAFIDTAQITGTLNASIIQAGELSADFIQLDNVTLDTATNGDLILREGGVFVDNLSVDSVGVVKFSLNNAYTSVGNQSSAFSSFTSSAPYYQGSFTFVDPETGYTTTTTVDLPIILTMTLDNGGTSPDLPEAGNSDYYIDFGAAIIGSAANSSSTSSSALVLSIKRRLANSSGSYSDYQSFASHNTSNGAIPLIPIDFMVKVTLNPNYDYQINLHGYIKGIDTGSNNQRGFASRKIRLFRIAKTS